MIGYLCAYFRYYYPMEFITAYLNNASNEDDIVNGTALARLKNVKIMPPRFRYSTGKYTIDRPNQRIYKGIGSIKYLNEQCAEELYELRDNQYETFTDLLIDVAQTSINTRQMEILIKLNFFIEFGKNYKLLKVYQAFIEYGDKSQIKKDKLNELPFNIDAIKAVSKETAKMFKVNDMIPIIRDYEANLDNTSLSPKDQIEAELEFLGYPETRYKCADTIHICIGINDKYTPKLNLYCLRTGETKTIKCYKKNLYDPDGNKYIDKGTVFNIVQTYEKNKMKMVDGSWVKLDETETILGKFEVIA